MPGNHVARPQRRHRLLPWTLLTVSLCVPFIAAAGPGQASTSASAVRSHAIGSQRLLARKAKTPAANLTLNQAVVQAQQTGKAVAVTGATTAPSTTTANADGTVTVSASAAPVRKKIDGAWKPLDATLVRNPDGTPSPKVTTQELILGAACSTRLATQGAGSTGFALDIPFSLPAATISGSTATYTDVLQGGGLVATADVQGALPRSSSRKNAQAAAMTAGAAQTLTWR